MPDQPQCDIIMKGGITSGVVYPKAILRLSQKYRFRSIGGTSAGAIAAVITAAAEYNRDGGGFKVIESLPEEIERILESLFQPETSVSPVFEIAKKLISNKPGRWRGAFLQFVRSYGLPFLGGFTMVMLGFLLFGSGQPYDAWVSVLLAIVAGFLFVALTVAVSILRLPGLNFGFCPGRTQVQGGPPALSDWLADKIELAAGRMKPDGSRPRDPLTFGEITKGKDGKAEAGGAAIDLRMMTTNLSVGRPHTLPDLDQNHYFKEDEFRKIFPDWIVDYLVRVSKAIQSDPRSPVPEGYLQFPVGKAMPLVVGARMSLSFPILFTTVPLYRKDFPFGAQGAEPPMSRMLFSDGGISSNFPVHFFDNMLPTRPTFGVSLEDWDDRVPDLRVALAVDPRRGIWLGSREIGSFAGLFGSIIGAAKDWQDRLQSTLPGYRERITNIYLDARNEGGLNLTMTGNTIATLVGFGDRAGGLMTGEPMSEHDIAAFDFNEHRWRRFLIAFARFEEALETAARVWSGDPKFSEFIREYKKAPKNYAESSQQWREDVYQRFDALMRMAQGWPQPPLRTANNGDNIPRPDSVMRITSKP